MEISVFKMNSLPYIVNLQTDNISHKVDVYQNQNSNLKNFEIKSL